MQPLGVSLSVIAYVQTSYLRLEYKPQSECLCKGRQTFHVDKIKA